MAVTLDDTKTTDNTSPSNTRRRRHYHLGYGMAEAINEVRGQTALNRWNIILLFGSYMTHTHTPGEFERALGTRVRVFPTLQRGAISITCLERWNTLTHNTHTSHTSAYKRILPHMRPFFVTTVSRHTRVRNNSIPDLALFTNSFALSHRRGLRIEDKDLKMPGLDKNVKYSGRCCCSACVMAALW